MEKKPNMFQSKRMPEVFSTHVLQLSALKFLHEKHILLIVEDNAKYWTERTGLGDSLFPQAVKLLNSSTKVCQK